MQSAFLESFYRASQLLITPVIGLLIVLSLVSVLLCGQTVRELFDRWVFGRAWQSYLRGLREGERPASQWRSAASYRLHRWFAKNARTSEDLRQLIPLAETRANRRLIRLQVLIRVGPMLGLVGTLIPLGPALQSLSTSNIADLGANLNVAFTTTVFGILIGAVAYALYVLQRQWAESDLAEMEYVLAKSDEINADSKTHKVVA